MTIMDLNRYINRTVRVDYRTKPGPQSRVGFVYTISTRKLILLAFAPCKKHSLPNRAEEEFEIYAPIKTIDRIREVKGAD